MEVAGSVSVGYGKEVGGNFARVGGNRSGDEVFISL